MQASAGVGTRRGSAGTLLVHTACGLLLLGGASCALYCPAFATSGCLTIEDLSEIASRGEAAELFEYLQDERSWVREESARAIGRARMAAGRAPLEEVLLDRGERTAVRAAAADALGRIGGAVSQPSLLAAIADPSAPPELKIAVLGAFCAVMGEGSLSMMDIQPLAEDEDLLVASVAEDKLITGCGRHQPGDR